MISRLRSRAGKWWQLARFFVALGKQGWDSSTIDEAAGITPALQNKMIVAGTVYDSLVESGELDATALAHFDRMGSAEDLLYPLRFLDRKMRISAAQYIQAKKLSTQVGGGGRGTVVDAYAWHGYAGPMR